MTGRKILLLLGVGIASTSVGVAIPMVLNGGTKAATSESDSGEGDHEPAPDKKSPDKTDEHGKPADSHAKSDAKKADDHGKASGSSKGGESASAATGPQFVSFGRIVTNLNEPSLTKYLSLEITLLTEGKDESAVKSAVESRMPILRTWLTGHLADKSMEDVRGKVGVNRLRREIQDQFNALLFDDGRERVRDVLFEEFHVE